MLTACRCSLAAASLAALLAAGSVPVAHARRGAPRATTYQSFEGEAALSYGKRIFRYYKPAKSQRLDSGVLRSMAGDFHGKFRAHGKKPNRGKPNKGKRWDRVAREALIKHITWDSLNDQGKAVYLERLFRQETSRQLRAKFINEYKSDELALTPGQWNKLAPHEQLKLVTYKNLNQQGQKRFKEIMREVFPMYRTSRVPRSFERVLFWESPNTYELRHHGKTASAKQVSQAVRWMKKKITEKVRPHRHVSWKPNLKALTTRRKEFLSFVQRTDLLMFSQRLEKGSRGALYGYYGKNFMPYSASKLKQIDESLVKRTYSLLLGSKLHGLGLRTYRDQTIGLEIRPVSDPKQMDWYADTVRTAVTRGALGKIKYDSAPLEFQALGKVMEAPLRARMARRNIMRPGKDMARWIDEQVEIAGLDQRLSYPLLAWEKQAFVPRLKQQLIGRERAVFVKTVSELLASRAAFKLDRDGLRDGLIKATQGFASRCRLSADLQRSITAPLKGKAGGPSIVAAP